MPGRAFTRRVYAMTVTKNKVPLLPHHHIRITVENKLDLVIWKQFLETLICYSRPFMHDDIATAMDIDMFSDAAKSS